MKIYAVRMGDYVEFRAAARPPRAKVSKLTKVTKVMQQTLVTLPTYPYAKYVDKPVKTTLVLKTVFYVGGRVLGVTKFRAYQRVPGAARFGRRRVIETNRAVITYLDRGGT